LAQDGRQYSGISIEAIYLPSSLVTVPKRGGLRVIYYYLTADQQIWFFTLYDKDEATDLTSGEKKALKRAIQAELEARRNRR